MKNNKNIELPKEGLLGRSFFHHSSLPQERTRRISAEKNNFSEDLIDNFIKYPDPLWLTMLEDLQENRLYRRDIFIREIKDEIDSEKTRNSLHIILRHAAFKGYIALIKWFFSNTVLLEILRNSGTKTINLIYEIRMAVYKNNPKLLRILLKNNENNSISWDELFLHAVEKKQVEIADLLLGKISSETFHNTLKNTCDFNILCVCMHKRNVEDDSFAEVFTNLVKSLENTTTLHPSASKFFSDLLDDVRITKEMQHVFFDQLLFKFKSMYLKEFFDNFLKIKPTGLSPVEQDNLTKYLRKVCLLTPIDGNKILGISFNLDPHRNEFKSSAIYFLLKNAPISEHNIEFLVMLLWTDFIEFNQNVKKDLMIKPWLILLESCLKHDSWGPENINYMEKIPAWAFNEAVCSTFKQEKQKLENLRPFSMWLPEPPASPEPAKARHRITVF